MGRTNMRTEAQQLAALRAAIKHKGPMGKGLGTLHRILQVRHQANIEKSYFSRKLPILVIYKITVK